MNNKIWLSSPTMHGEEQMFVKEAFDTNWVAPLGKNVTEFENEIARYVGCKAAAAVTAGTHALHLACILAEIGRDDIVICSDMTFAATVNPVSYLGGRQVFVDSERETWNMNPEALKAALDKYGKKVKAVIVANLYGTPAKLDEIKKLCDDYGVILIEDAAESLSATYKGKQTGTFGKYNAISFNGNKIITGTSGGVLLSDDEAAISKAKFLSTQAREPFPWYQHCELGYNYRMSNLIAGVARGQLLHLDQHKAMKKKIWQRYQNGLKDLPVQMNPFVEHSEPNYWLSCLTINKDSFGDGIGKATPEKIRLTLDEYNVESRPIWKPMHLQPLYADRDFITVGNDNVGEDIFTRGLCLPSDLNMTEEQQAVVIEIIKNCF